MFLYRMVWFQCIGDIFWIWGEGGVVVDYEVVCWGVFVGKVVGDGSKIVS